MKKPTSKPGLRVVLVRVRNPLNIGAVARAMSNFGFDDLTLVSPYDASWQEAKSAVGAAAVLGAARVYTSLQEAIADRSLVVGTAGLDHREARQPVRRLETGGGLIRKHIAAGGRAALVFGSEKHGLSNDDLSLCQWLIRIPTRGEHESMNLGQAVAVCLYDQVRQNAPRTPRQTKPVVSGQLDLIEVRLMEVLQQAGYLTARTAPSSRLKVRRLLRRMDLSGNDAEIWLGMLRQIGWKIGQTN